MVRAKFEVGEVVEMRCLHLRQGEMVADWLPGTVVAADLRMLAVRFEAAVYANNGLAMPDRILWCAHGSPNLRRPAERGPADLKREVNSDG